MSQERAAGFYSMRESLPSQPSGFVSKLVPR